MLTLLYFTHHSPNISSGDAFCRLAIYKRRSHTHTHTSTHTHTHTHTYTHTYTHIHTIIIDNFEIYIFSVASVKCLTSQYQTDILPSSTCSRRCCRHS